MALEEFRNRTGISYALEEFAYRYQISIIIKKVYKKYIPYNTGDICSTKISRGVTKKQTKWHVCPAKTHPPCLIRSSLSAWRNVGSLLPIERNSEDSDQSGRMPRLIWVFAVRTCHCVGFVVLRLIIGEDGEAPDNLSVIIETSTGCRRLKKNRR